MAHHSPARSGISPPVKVADWGVKPNKLTHKPIISVEKLASRIKVHDSLMSADQCAHSAKEVQRLIPDPKALEYPSSSHYRVRQ